MMKRWRTVWCLLLAAIVAMSAPGADPVEASRPVAGRVRVEWMPARIVMSVAPGETVTTVARFRVSSELSGAFLRTRSPNGAASMKFNSGGLPNVLLPGVTYAVPLVITIRPQHRGRQIVGRAFLGSAGRLHGPGLYLKIAIARPAADEVVLTPAAARHTRINVLDGRFQLRRMTVIAGRTDADEVGTLTWTNRGQETHRLASVLSVAEGGWDSGDLAPGEDFSFRFMTRGDYEYVCLYHADDGMRARVIVK